MKGCPSFVDDESASGSIAKQTRPSLVIAAMLGGLAAPAAAGGFDRTFAELVGVEPSAVVDATAFGLASGAYTHVVVGHVRREDREEPHAYLLRCDAARCVGTPLWLEPGTLEVLGVVDLDGPAVAFPRRPVAPRVLRMREAVCKAERVHTHWRAAEAADAEHADETHAQTSRSH